MGSVPYESIVSMSPFDRAVIESQARQRIQRAPTTTEKFSAAFRNVSDFGHAYGIGERWGERIYYGGDLEEDAYNAYLDEDLSNYQDFLEEFEDSGSHLETEAIKKRLDMVRERDRVMAAGGGMGVAASLLAGLSGPSNLLIPGSFARGVGRVAQAARFAAAGAGSAALYEVGAQLDDPRRTAGDALASIGGAAFLSGLLGGAIKPDRSAALAELASKERKALLAKRAEERTVFETQRRELREKVAEKSALAGMLRREEEFLAAQLAKARAATDAAEPTVAQQIEELNNELTRERTMLFLAERDLERLKKTAFSPEEMVAASERVATLRANIRSINKVLDTDGQIGPTLSLARLRRIVALEQDLVAMRAQLDEADAQLTSRLQNREESREAYRRAVVEQNNVAELKERIAKGEEALAQLRAAPDGPPTREQRITAANAQRELAIHEMRRAEADLAADQSRLASLREPVYPEQTELHDTLGEIAKAEAIDGVDLLQAIAPALAEGKSVGAMAADAQRASPRLAKLEKERLVRAFGWLVRTPAVRMAKDPSDAVRVARALLNSTPFVLKGASTLSTGLEKVPADALKVALVRRLRGVRAQIRDIFTEYRMAGADTVTSRMRRRFGGTGREIRTRLEFFEMVGRAIRNGGELMARDAARITEEGAKAAVRRAAAAVIKERDELTALAVQYEILTGDDLLKDYFTRVLNRPKIVASPATGPGSFSEALAQGYSLRNGVPIDEARASAMGTYERVLGEDPGHMGFFGESGRPMRGRVIDLETDPYLSEWVIDNVDEILQIWERTYPGRIAMKIATGDVDGATLRQSIIKDYTRLLDAEKSPAKRVKLTKARETALLDFDHMVNQILDRTFATSEPGHIAYRIGNAIKSLAYMATGALLVPRSIMDPGAMIPVAGLASFARMMKAVGGDLRLLKGAAPDEIQRMLIANDVLMGARRHQFLGIDKIPLGMESKIERWLEGETQRFSTLTGLNHWTAYASSAGSLAISDNVLRNSARLTAAGILDGTLPAAAVKRLEAAGFTREAAEETLSKLGRLTPDEMTNLSLSRVNHDLAARITQQHRIQETKWIGKGGADDPDGLWVSSSQNWEDSATKLEYQAVVNQDVGRAINAPRTGETPRMAGKPLLGLLFMYRRFNFAVTQNILISGLQRNDAAFYQGVAAMTGLGLLSYMLHTKLKGGELADDPLQWVAEAIDYGAPLGILNNEEVIFDRFTGLGRSNLPWGRTSRNADQDLLDAIGGPVYSYATDLVGGVSGLARGGATASEIHRVRRLLPYQNAAGINRFLDGVEKKVVQVLGLPDNRKKKRQAGR